MKNKYEYGNYIDLNDYKTVTYGKYVDMLERYYFDIETETTEESKEEKVIRLAKEKSEKRNNKIDQLLGE